MLTSASRNRSFNGARDTVVSVTWKRAKSRKAAFIDEYLTMESYTKELDQKILYNKIWSPGRKYYRTTVK